MVGTDSMLGLTAAAFALADGVALQVVVSGSATRGAQAAAEHGISVSSGSSTRP